MKNLAPGFADMSNSSHDLMSYKLSAKFNVSSRGIKLLPSLENLTRLGHIVRSCGIDK